MKRLKSLLAKAALVFLGIFIAICIAELFCRLFPNITGIHATVSSAIPRIYAADEKKGYTLLPGSIGRHRSIHGEFDVTYNINSQGLRSLKEAYSRKSGKRILLLGDSFIFGNGVDDDETLAVRLEEELNRSNPAIKLEVINTGVGGYATDQEYITLKMLAYLKPDIVLLGLCPDDFNTTKWIRDKTGDIVKVTEAGCYVNRHNQLILSPRPASRLKQFGRDHLFLYSFLSTLRHRIVRSSEAWQRNLQFEQDKWENSLAVLSLIKGHSEKNNAKFAVFSVGGGWSTDHLAEHLGIRGISFFDISELHSKNKNLCFPKDAHWSPDGTVVVADWLASCLREEVIGEK